MALTQIDRSSQIKAADAYRILVNDSTGKMSENAALTAARALVSDANGQLDVSATTATELGYVSGVTSGIQAQLNALATGLSWKTAALVATTAELTQAYTQTSATVLTETSAGDGVLQDIDGHTPVNGDRILVKNELTTKAKNNGIYIVTNAGAVAVKASLVSQGVTYTAVNAGASGNSITIQVVDTGGSGPATWTDDTGAIVIDLVGLSLTPADVQTLSSGSAYVTATGTTGSVVVHSVQSLANGADAVAWVLTRANDMFTWAEVPAAAVFVEEGTANADIAFVCTSDPGGTLGTTAITFVAFASVVSGVTSITKSGGSPETGAITLAGTSNQIVITDSPAGTFTFSTPQDINTSATPSFASETLSAATNQLVLGTTRTVTVTAPEPASSSRVVTIPDLGGDYSVVGTIAAQTIGGAKTLTSALTINPATNQLVLGGVGAGFKVTISSTAPSADRILTIPAATGDRNFLLSGEAQIVTGDISASAGITLSQLASITEAHIVVGAASTGVPTSVTMSGDVSIIASGATSISGGLTNHLVVREVPSGSKPGTVFTLAYTPVADTECVYLNGMLQQSGGADYTYSAPGSVPTLTFVSTILTTDVVLVNYTK